MPAKTPIYLKTPTDRKGRRLKLRDLLSGDMISPPLGDVRHSAHVGPQGLDDMFGDVAFLEGSMDMLPSLRAPHDRHESSLQAPYPTMPSSLWSTTSLPLLMAQEQAPPKPPRLHLDLPPQHGPAHCAHLDPAPQQSTLCAHLDLPPQHEPAHSAHLYTSPQNGPAQCAQLDTPPQHGPTHCAHLDTPPQHGPAHCPHDWDVSLSHTIRQLVPSSGSSSDDSLFDTCGPLGVPRGLSLDSDAGLSNEDLRSTGSSSTLPRTDSILASLNLDLGPSIMEDVLSIMDRYRGPSLNPGP